MLIARIVAGFLVATVIGITSRRAGVLSRSGAVAATALGTAAAAAGWSWAVLLVAYFVASSALSRVGGRRAAARTAGIVEKAGARDARQVLANGGTFGLAAVAALLAPDALPLWMAIGAGTLAASAADTWGTEIGTAFGGTPRLVYTMRRVPAGTSGGITLLGSLATLAGASFVALVAWGLRWPDHLATAALLGGVAGAFADTIAGATIQERRWCERCRTATEQRLHRCGEPTWRTGGIPGLDNDTVNAVATLVGAAVAASLAL